MRILQLHADYMEYEPIAKELEMAEEAERRKHVFEDIVVLFMTVEEGDGQDVVEGAIKEVTSSLERLGTKRALVYPYSHLSNRLANPTQALALVKEFERRAREEGLEVYRSPFGWTKAFSIKIKGHPLAEQSKYIGGEEREALPEAVDAERRLESYWHVLTPEGEFIPVEKFDFTNHEGLRKLARYEMAKDRTVYGSPPHIALMRRHELVDFEAGSDPGNLRYYPKGRLVKALIEAYVNQRVREYGGLEVETPIMYDFKHPSLASYLNRFPARQYVVKSEEKELFLRFSACFGQFLMMKDAQLTYKQMPFKIYELTRYSFRREKSGELSGLRRLRAFTMPDCHAFCRDLDQAKEEAVLRIELSRSVLEEIGLDGRDYEMAIRFTEDFFSENREFLVSLVARLGRPVLAEVWKERFFYFIMKWEFNFVDGLEKASALSTDQIDVENAMRYGISYTDADGQKRYPIILHCSPSGAVERCIYALLEKADMMTGSEAPHLPLWLSPVQVRIIPMSEKHLSKAGQLAEKLGGSGVRVDIDDREQTVSRRIRDAEMEWIRYTIVFGDRELEGEKYPVRDREEGVMRVLSLEELVEEIRLLTKGRPYLPLPLPILLSKRPSFTH